MFSFCRQAVYLAEKNCHKYRDIPRGVKLIFPNRHYGHPGQPAPTHSKKQFSAYGEVAYCIDIASRI